MNHIESIGSTPSGLIIPGSPNQEVQSEDQNLGTYPPPLRFDPHAQFTGRGDLEPEPVWNRFDPERLDLGLPTNQFVSCPPDIGLRLELADIHSQLKKIQNTLELF